MRVFILFSAQIARVCFGRCILGLKIALISPLYESVPPRLYGGTERIVASLADNLVELGHDVTLFASGDSRTRARLVSVRACAIRLDRDLLYSELGAHLHMLDQVRRRADTFDLLHFHLDPLHLPLFEDIAERTLTTLHGRLDLQDLAPIYRRWHRYPLVSISDQQREPLPFANWVATVHHGIAVQRYTFSARPREGYLAFLGRISREKRPDRAIAIARRANMPLKIAAKVDPADRGYFHDEIEPLLADPLVEYLGEIPDSAKSQFLGNATALLFPIDWPEPFGLVMIEAMACGTPVIAWDCGSVPEIIDHGVTGFIVESEDEALDAIGRIGSIGRRRVRECCERRFGAAHMAREYVKVYTLLLDRLQQGARTEGLSRSMLENARS